MKRVSILSAMVICSFFPISFCFNHHQPRAHLQTLSQRRHCIVQLKKISRQNDRKRKFSKHRGSLKAIDDDKNWSYFSLSKDDIYRSMALLLLSQFLLFIGVGAVIPSIPLYGKELGFSSAVNGIVISAPAVALVAGAKFSGNYADQARKPALVIGMALIMVSDLATAAANGLIMLLVARLGLGAGRCVSEAGERGLLADLANQIPELRGRALAAQQAVMALGIAIGAPCGGIVVEKYGPRAAFLCVSAAALVAMILYFFLPETQAFAKEEHIGDRTGTAKDANTESQESADWADLWSQNQWRGLTLCQSGAGFGFAAKIASIPVLAAANIPGGAIGSGLLLSAAGISGLFGAPIGGFLIDRTSARTTIIISGIFCAFALMLVPVALTFPYFDGDAAVSIGDTVLKGKALAFSSAVLLWSTAAAAQGPALTALAQELAPSGREATALALPRAAGDATYIFAPFLLGLVADSSLQVPGLECAAAGSMTLVGVVAIILLRDETKFISK
jgi:MFS family permease